MRNLLLMLLLGVMSYGQTLDQSQRNIRIDHDNINIVQTRNSQGAFSHAEDNYRIIGDYQDVSQVRIDSLQLGSVLFNNIRQTSFCSNPNFDEPCGPIITWEFNTFTTANAGAG